MSIKHSVAINSSAREIFAIYADASSWAQWDPDIEDAQMDGEFTTGATGWIKPKGAPKTRTHVVELTEPYSFSVESKLPLCTMLFTHQLEESGQQTTATHAVHFKGLLAPLYSRLIGGKIKSGIDGTMQGLKNYAEKRE